MRELAGKRAVITGAGRGLGAAFAFALADAGCRLILCGRKSADLDEIAGLIAARGHARPDRVLLDLAQAESVRDAATKIAAKASTVDILINNGAMWLEAGDTPHDPADVLAVVNAAVTGTFLLVQDLRPVMETSDSPDILTIGSISGLPNAALQSVSVPFYAAKRAQLGLAEGLRQQFAGTKFRSLLVNPPYLDDARPDQPDWTEAAQRAKGARATSRDVVEAAIYALTRPRHISLTIELDADEGGLHPRPPSQA